MRFYYILISFLVAAPLQLLAQQPASPEDITGLWKGTLYNDTTKQYYKYEIGISSDKNGLSGFSHTWFLLDDKQYYGVKKIRIKRSGNKIIVEDAGLIANNYPVAPAKGVKQLNVLELNAEDSVMTLTGSFSTNRTKDYSPLTGTIRLERKNDYWQSALIPHLQELNLAHNLSFVEDENLLTRNNIAIAAAEKKQIHATQELATQNIKVVNAKVIPPLPVSVREEPAGKTDSDLAVRFVSQPGASPKSISKPISAASQNSIAVNSTKDTQSSKHVEEETRRNNGKKSDLSAIVKSENSAAASKTKMIADKEVAAKKANAGTTPNVQDGSVAGNSEHNTDERPTALQVNSGDSVYAIALPPKNAQRIPEQAGVKPAKEIAAETAPQIAVKELSPTKALDNPVPASLPTAALNVANRTTTIQQTVSFHSDSLQLSLYDNGEVDGDTVSVLMNGNIIMAKERLSTNAVRKTIFIPQNTDTVQLLMYAENLGSIPPNTGLLVVKDGKDLYEIRFSGDLQKNAAIIFKRKKATSP